MSLLLRPITIIGDRGRARVECLFDTGASYSLIREEVARKIAPLYPAPRPLTFILGDGRGRLHVSQVAPLRLLIPRCHVIDPNHPERRGRLITLERGEFLYVSSHLARDLIIGDDLMQKWALRLFPRRKDLAVERSALETLLA